MHSNTNESLILVLTIYYGCCCLIQLSSITLQVWDVSPKTPFLVPVIYLRPHLILHDMLGICQNWRKNYNWMRIAEWGMTFFVVSRKLNLGSAWLLKNHKSLPGCTRFCRKGSWSIIKHRWYACCVHSNYAKINFYCLFNKSSHIGSTIDTDGVQEWWLV